MRRADKTAGVDDPVGEGVAVWFYATTGCRRLFSKTARNRYSENWGLNRVTQEVIDRGRDLTGATGNLASDFAKYPFEYVDVKGLPVIFANVATVGGHGGAGLRSAELEMGDVCYPVGQSRDLWPDGSDQPPPAVIKAGRP